MALIQLWKTSTTHSVSVYDYENERCWESVSYFHVVSLERLDALRFVLDQRGIAYGLAGDLCYIGNPRYLDDANELVYKLTALPMPSYKDELLFEPEPNSERLWPSATLIPYHDSGSDFHFRYRFFVDDNLAWERQNWLLDHFDFDVTKFYWKERSNYHSSIIWQKVVIIYMSDAGQAAEYKLRWV